jgi:hypothetical protein
MINLEIPDRSTIGLAHPLILLRTSWQKFAAVPNKLPSCLELQIEQRTRQNRSCEKKSRRRASMGEFPADARGFDGV